MAADKVFERAWGKAPEYNPAQEAEPLNYLATLRAEKLTSRELDAIAELAEARLAAIEARQARVECDDDHEGLT
jgi:hypothetical protein